MNNNIDLSEVKQITELFAAALKDRLARDNTNASGTLSKSIRDIVKYDGKYISVAISLEDYWKYVENGRKAGKFPPINKIKEWIRIKPVIPYTKNNKLPTENQLAYLIGRKIARKGTPANPFLAPTIRDFDLVDKLYSVVNNMFIEQVNKDFNEELLTNK